MLNVVFSRWKTEARSSLCSHVKRLRCDYSALCRRSPHGKDVKVLRIYPCSWRKTTESSQLGSTRHSCHGLQGVLSSRLRGQRGSTAESHVLRADEEPSHTFIWLFSFCCWFPFFFFFLRAGNTEQRKLATFHTLRQDAPARFTTPYPTLHTTSQPPSRPRPTAAPLPHTQARSRTTLPIMHAR